MALQHKIFVSGSIGPVIFYERNGVPCARAKPTKVRQTKATKAASKEFGKAVRYSRILRDALQGIIPFPKDKSVMYRLNNALLDWLRASKDDHEVRIRLAKYFEKFEFNKESELSYRLRKNPLVSFETPGIILVNIPAFLPKSDIAAPNNTRSVAWEITAVSCNTNSELPWRYSTRLEMNYDTNPIPGQEIKIPFKINSNDLVLVVISLKYTAMRNEKLAVVSEPRWLPAGVVAATYS